ncbi:MAG: heme exporter protein CcmB [Coriobacteriia bacterium]|nr:heme exporter protein CcmB [Coriobacteriia bacterium]MCL2537366.1 heme exporter protein CcmB [Coriobacteriia bacterium]
MPALKATGLDALHPVLPNISSWRQYKAILRKDIAQELRTREMVTSMGLYGMLVLVIYYIALSQTGLDFDVTRIAAGLLLLMIVFTSMLGLNRSMIHEHDQGQLEALLLAPIDRPIIFLAKATTNLLFLLIVQIVVVPVFYIMYVSGSLPVQLGEIVPGPWWMIALGLTIGSIGVAGVGTLLATISVNSKGRDFILAVLFIPVMYPLLLVLVAALNAVIGGAVGFESVFWMNIAGAAIYNAVVIAAAFVLYDFILGV